MPHLIIEYAAELESDVDIQQLAKTAFDGAVASKLFTPANIKSRAHPVQAYWIGGKKVPFVHVNVKLLPGRTNEQKKTLTTSVFDAIKKLVGDAVKVSVEANDIEADVYTKG
ncbi:MAG: 5-carboxymethyl-2-hydroxymuconate Delta-isomerase [Magnetovibrio sp.]|nr:5-carboxymethyl-2-hydroxymuconate Delta-isomerase [Magnetovibrio sp.]